MTTAIFPGSFDPVTVGHMHLIERASHLVDRLIVAIGVNTQKTGYFTPEERLEILSESVADLPNVTVQIETGLTTDFAASVGATVIIRGLRNVTDFEYEQGIAGMNQYLNPKIETVFLLANPADAFVSSSLIKEVIQFGADITGVLPPAAAKAIEQRRNENAD
ncbi:pantetheine-phosphate adenylyltransferase [Levilactobacillus bambusae]|uniref:Phosphopantetheine adenylyltransferase n=1 Tax=Levilactobacillus bambusae TaxID=2024736 RepID=A0A2V1N3J2_9LACO|nr:pantetheine-phosphate adenylyltransferase [Levilactobacillus bambusae]PWG00675.1 pantetheine-phosphate adenylyltransferase [Levilactobacillus bambusae]